MIFQLDSSERVEWDFMKSSASAHVSILIPA